MAFSGKWKRDACCDSGENFPSPVSNLLILELTGYNYRTIPRWFTEDGEEMTALQFHVDADNLYYRWTFYKPLNATNSKLYLSTSDDIFPVIFSNGENYFSGRKLNVQRASKHNGYTTWKVNFS